MVCTIFGKRENSGVVGMTKVATCKKCGKGKIYFVGLQPVKYELNEDCEGGQ